MKSASGKNLLSAIELRGASLNLSERLEKVGGRVDLWNYGKWDTSKLEDAVFECNAISDFTAPGGFLLFWFPLTWLHKPRFAPSDIKRHWKCVGSIMNATQIAYIFRKPHSVENKTPDLGCKRFFAETDVQRSSVISRYLIERFCAPGSVIVDAEVDKMAHLARWAKRSGVHYMGYAKNADDLAEIDKKLAQVELPMVQERLFDDRSANQPQ